MVTGPVLEPARASNIAAWRFLDVVFSHRRLLAGLPLVAAAVGLTLGAAIDRTESVSTRIWADVPPAYTDAASIESRGASPAASVTAVIKELLGTDSFVTGVLAGVDPELASKPSAQRADATARFRRSVHVAIEGPHLITITTRTSSASEGTRTLRSLVSRIDAALQAMQLGQATARGEIATAQLAAARAAVDEAVARLREYTNAMPIGTTAEDRTQDAGYQALAARVVSTNQFYEALLLVTQNAQSAQAAVPVATGLVFRVIDPPSPDPAVISLRSTFLRVGLAAGTGALLLESIAMYVVARRDPRIRTGLEVAQACGVRYLGSAGRLDTGPG